MDRGRRDVEERREVREGGMGEGRGGLWREGLHPPSPPSHKGEREDQIFHLGGVVYTV